MRSIYKYQIDFHQVGNGQFSLRLPVGAEILSCQVQYDQPVIWAMIDLSQPQEDRPLAFWPTGMAIPFDGYMRHVDSIQMYGGDLVFHLFDLRAP